MSQVNVLVVEDEPLVSQRVVRHVREHLGDAIGTIEIADDIAEAIERLQAGTIDLLMLDLNLHGEDGFGILEEMTSYAAQTIIVSAYADQAARAFDYGVVDFVTKPFDSERIGLAVGRFGGTSAARTEKAKFLSFRSGRRIERVDLEEVVLIRGADKYSDVVLADGRVKLHDKSIGKLEPVLPASFLRIHKSYIVRIDAVAGLESFAGNRHELVTKTGERAPVSRSLIGEVRALFQ